MDCIIHPQKKTVGTTYRVCCTPARISSRRFVLYIKNSHKNERGHRRQSDGDLCPPMIPLPGRSVRGRTFPLVDLRHQRQRLASAPPLNFCIPRRCPNPPFCIAAMRHLLKSVISSLGPSELAGDFNYVYLEKFSQNKMWKTFYAFLSHSASCLTSSVLLCS